jgi:hypothetical protein
MYYLKIYTIILGRVIIIFTDIGEPDPKSLETSAPDHWYNDNQQGESQ